HEAGLLDEGGLVDELGILLHSALQLSADMCLLLRRVVRTGRSRPGQHAGGERDKGQQPEPTRDVSPQGSFLLRGWVIPLPSGTLGSDPGSRPSFEGRNFVLQKDEVAAGGAGIAKGPTRAGYGRQSAGLPLAQPCPASRYQSSQPSPP